MLWASGCVGPPASDVEVCRDLVHRLCLSEVCPQVVPLVPTGRACEATLREATGCAQETFSFIRPSREQFLSCRADLLKAGQGPEQHPACADVGQSFSRCPDLVQLLKGVK